MSEGAFQTDLFGGIKRFFSGGESEKVEEAPPQISGDGTVLFRYADRLKKSIRCRKKNFEKYNGEIASIEQEFSLRRQEILDKTENEIQQYKNTVLSSPQDTSQFNELLDGILDKWN